MHHTPLARRKSLDYFNTRRAEPRVYPWFLIHRLSRPCKRMSYGKKIVSGVVASGMRSKADLDQKSNHTIIAIASKPPTRYSRCSSPVDPLTQPTRPPTPHNSSFFTIWRILSTVVVARSLGCRLFIFFSSCSALPFCTPFSFHS